MKQITLTTVNFDRYSKTTRRAAVIARMGGVMPWPALCPLIELVYRKVGNGRAPVGLERMLSICILHNWFSLSDPAVEEALCDSLRKSEFADVELECEAAPDEAIARKFSHPLEEDEQGSRWFEKRESHLLRIQQTRCA